MPAAPLAYLDLQRQVHALDADGRSLALTQPVSELLWGSWRARRDHEAHSWPTWSPDAERLACFRIERTGKGSGVLVLEPGAVTQTEVLTLERRVPIYLQWAPDGRTMAVVSQRGDELELDVAASDEPGRTRRLASGSPLFIAWRGPDRIVAFVGQPEERSRLVALDLNGEERERYPGTPGNFCAPVVLGSALMYVAHRDGSINLQASDSDGTRRLEPVGGLAAITPAPDGRRAAMSIAPDADQAEYRALRIVDASGSSRVLTDMPHAAFLWSPTGDALIVAQMHGQQPTVGWYRLGLDGDIDHIIDLVPTRDLRFYLRFFEQYAPSHPLLDPSGTSLVLAGSPVGGGDAKPRLWLVPIAGGPAEELGEGLFGVFPTGPAPGSER